MSFLKKHYEKVLLSLVLLGLAVAAALLPMKVAEAQAKVNEIRNTIFTPPVKELAAVDLSTNIAVLSRLGRPGRTVLDQPHYLFNPVTWQRKPDGSILKVATADDLGPRAVQITAIHPLYLEIAFVGITGADDSRRYQISVKKETDRNPRPRTFLTRMNDRNEVFLLREVRGPQENPDQFVLELVDSKQIVTLTKDKPFQQVVGHSADMRYDPENKSFPKSKVGSKVTLARENYKIIEINENQVVFSHDSTDKRTIVSLASPKP